MEKVACIFSGGMDSTVLMHKLIKDYGAENIMPLYMQYGQRNFEIEKETVLKFCKKYGVQEPMFVDLTSAFNTVPKESDGNKYAVEGGAHNCRSMINRNMIFISVAVNKAITAGCTKLFSGSCWEDGIVVNDGTEEFYERIKGLLTYQYPDFEFCMPFMENRITKENEINLGIDLGMTEDDFDDTWSCYVMPTEKDENGRFKACGKCHACLSSIVPLRKVFGPSFRSYAIIEDEIKDTSKNWEKK